MLWFGAGVLRKKAVDVGESAASTLQGSESARKKSIQPPPLYTAWITTYLQTEIHLDSEMSSAAQISAQKTAETIQR